MLTNKAGNTLNLFLKVGNGDPTDVALLAGTIANFAAGTTLEATQGQILSQSPTDATRFWWRLYGS